MRGACELSENGTQNLAGEINTGGSAASPHLQGVMTYETRQNDISWPQVPGADGTLRIPSFAERSAPEGRGGSRVQRKRTRDVVRENKDRTKHAAESRECKLPPGEEAHLPQDAWKAAQFASDNGPNLLRFFPARAR